MKSFILLQGKRGLVLRRLTSPLQVRYVYKMPGSLKTKNRLKLFSHKNTHL